ncbi:hypothetical protein MTR67_034497 [Solanum verrucosum]|uniref:Tf2-1-like SH3-like domain-containing protein n=1 Tax=Solanum verrucosum TaxID=315347 RepID=A0AAF0U8A3_SOLVR|nr:hypothetical protein MTR67_034497 [Solanum verrucosum]
MDFVTDLPHSFRKFDSIWIIIDRLTKSTHFLLVKTYYTAEDYAKLYIKEITDGQAERTIQTLEDMLRACVLDFKGPDLVLQVMEKVKVIQQRLATAQSQYKSYADVRRRGLLEFSIGDWVFLKVLPMKGVMRFGKKGKLSPRYVGPYKIIRRVGQVAYELELPQELSAAHPVFHVSMLRKCVGDLSYITPIEDVQVTGDLTYEEVPIAIMDRQVKKLRNKEMALVKVLWRNQQVENVTWEAEEAMKSKYPYLFEPKREVQGAEWGHS